MNDYITEITLDLNCKAPAQIIRAGQFDCGRKIKINITADGESFDISECTAVCKGVKSDNKHAAVDCTISDNAVLVVLDEQMLAVKGLLIAKIVLSDSAKTYSTGRFMVDVDGSLEGDITSSDIYSVLNSLLQKVQSLSDTGAILPESIDYYHLKDEIVNINKLGGKSVSLEKLADETREYIDSKIANEASTVSTNNLADKSVTSPKVADKSILARHLYGIDNEPVGGSTNLIYSTAVYKAINDLKKAVDTALSAKQDLDKLITQFDILFTDDTDSKYPTVNAVVNYLKDYFYDANETDELLSEKYNSSNVESGSGTLTVVTQTAIDSELFKSCNFEYVKIGDLIHTFINIVFNAGSASFLQLKGLPFTCNDFSTMNRFMTATSKTTQALVYNDKTWLNINFLGTKTLVQDEVLKFVITTKLN